MSKKRGTTKKQVDAPASVSVPRPIPPIIDLRTGRSWYTRDCRRRDQTYWLSWAGAGLLLLIVLLMAVGRPCSQPESSAAVESRLTDAEQNIRQLQAAVNHLLQGK